MNRKALAIATVCAAQALVASAGVSQAGTTPATTPPATASVVNKMVETLQYADPNDKLAPGPYGTVTVEQLTNGDLYFQVDLASGVYFNSNNNSNHDAFAFNADVSGLTVAIINNSFNSKSPTFSAIDLGSTFNNEPPFNNGAGFNYLIDYNGKSLGIPQGSGPQSLDFYLYSTSPSINLALSDLKNGATFGSAGIAFTSDIIATNGQTGNVGAIPEPGTWALMLLGVGSVFGALRFAKGARTLRIASA
jgi:hypothetical protein